MSDFEDQLRSALHSGVSDELSVAGLADGARSKLRRRRRTAGSIVGAAALVAAIPVGFAALNNGGSGPGQGAIAAETSTAAGLPAGWHWESYANIEFGVPDSWKHGSPNQWCVGGDLAQAWVSRPNEVQTLVACLEPANGYGAEIGIHPIPGSGPVLHPGQKPGEPVPYNGRGDFFPAGSWLVYLGADEGIPGGDGDFVEVRVTAPDQATAQGIADSFRTFDGTDANGCASRQGIPRIGTATGLSARDSGPIVLCTYSGTTPGANLAGSEPLSADRARALLDAMATAKDDGSGVPAAECFAEDPDATLILRGGDPLGWAFNTMCSDSGVDVGGDVLPMSAALMEALYGFAPTDPPDGGVVTDDPDGSVSNDGTITPDVVVPPDTASPPDSGGGGSSGSSGSSGSVGGNAGSETATK